MMKKVMISLILLTASSFAFAQAPDPSVLLGSWKMDMSPDNPSDNNFAMIRITKASDNQIKGVFYREGVKIKEGRFTTQMGKLYGAVVSGDNSGTYNSTFYYKDGQLYGTTHSLGRDFLSVWTATKINESK
ncbi:MAG: hypothetical protein AAFY71_01455 [Bacteroidota bacterium]